MTRALVRVGASGILYRMRLMRSPAVMEMHVFARAQLEEFLRGRGGRVKAVDPASDPRAPFLSLLYYVAKEPARAHRAAR
jgi:hypothetical protein